MSQDSIPPTVKLELLTKTGFLCEKCRTYQSELTFHHIIPRSMASALKIKNINAPTNLRVLCLPCHRKEHQKTAFAFKKEEIEFILGNLKHQKDKSEFCQKLIEKLFWYLNEIIDADKGEKILEFVEGIEKE